MGTRLSLEDQSRLKTMVVSGANNREICSALGIGRTSAKKWRNRLQGESSIPVMGRPVRGVLSQFPKAIPVAIRRLRRSNPGWGGKVIRYELMKNGWPEEELPSRSSLNRFLKAEGLIRFYDPHSPLPCSSCDEATKPHQLWELDAEGNVQLEGVGPVAMINIKDVGSRYHVSSYPAQMRSAKGHPDGEDYQTALRLGFCQYGLPEQIQTDHASVFYDNHTQSPFPTRFHLWLISLGVKLCFSRIHRPTDQAHVERSHQTMHQQALAGKAFTNWEHLYHHVQNRRAFINDRMPCDSLQGKSPKQAFPDALQCSRPYTPQAEAQMMDLQNVYNYLKQGTWFRRVASNRTVSLGGQTYYVGLKNYRQMVKITFDAKTQKLMFYDKEENLIKQYNIRNLNLPTLSGKQYLAIHLPAVQLKIPFDIETAKINQGSRLYETPRGSALSET